MNERIREWRARGGGWPVEQMAALIEELIEDRGAWIHRFNMWADIDRQHRQEASAPGGALAPHEEKP